MEEPRDYKDTTKVSHGNLFYRKPFCLSDYESDALPLSNFSKKEKVGFEPTIQQKLRLLQVS